MYEFKEEFKTGIPMIDEEHARLFEIAEELYISVETVKRHMSTIFEKLGIESRKQLIKLANII